VKTEKRDATVSFRVPAWAKEKAIELFEADIRRWHSSGEYFSHLFTEALLNELPAREAERLRSRLAGQKAG